MPPFCFEPARGGRMVFILSNDGRYEDSPNGIKKAFERYRDYLKQNEAAFPPRSYQLATSDWFYYPNDHRCPHDAWLVSFQMTEMPVRKALKPCSISIRLLGAYHDGHIEIIYPRVFSYSLQCSMAGNVTTHGDWWYDEFRLSERGHMIHKIEWAPQAQSKPFSWIIEADDIDFRWIPMKAEQG
jgi:hypothetical protein